MEKKDFQKEMREAWIAEGVERSELTLNIIEHLFDHIDELKNQLRALGTKVS